MEIENASAGGRGALSDPSKSLAPHHRSKPSRRVDTAAHSRDPGGMSPRHSPDVRLGGETYARAGQRRRLSCMQLTHLATATLLALSPALQAQQAMPDPQMQAVLDELTVLNGQPIALLSPEEARKQPSPADAVLKLMKKLDIKGPEPVGDVDNKSVKLGAGHDIDVRIYTPKGDGPFPVILYIHGGGWVIADLDTYDSSPRALCNAVGAVVVSTAYRQAPEHKFPAAHEDVFAIYQWVLKNEEKRNYDATRLAVVGESAGGNMAAAISLMARAEGVPLPVRQVLVYPVVAPGNMTSPSYLENAEAKPLNKAMMEWFATHALATREDRRDPRLSLLMAGDALKSMPATTIILAQIDPLRSEGEELAKALMEAGVKVNQKTYPGVTHEFFGMGAVVDKAREAVGFAAADLRAAFGTKPEPSGGE